MGTRFEGSCPLCKSRLEFNKATFVAARSTGNIDSWCKRCFKVVRVPLLGLIQQERKDK